MSIILASASPRRRELLEMMGLEFEIVPAKNETAALGISPADDVSAIALGKALEVAENRSLEDIVIAADTLVCVDGKLLGKPANREEAYNMLRILSGKEHQVYTGVAVVYNGRSTSCAEMTAVRFCEMTDSDIWNYIDTNEPMDKAGAYGIQGRGAVFIEGITGDYFNVMGLPLHRLHQMLKEFGCPVL